MIIMLTTDEAKLAFSVGRCRQNDNQLNKRTDYNKADSRDGELLHIVGALGEIAVAKMLGLNFCAKTALAYSHQSGDLSNMLEVRTRGNLSYDYMYMHEKDRADLVYVHAKLNKPHLTDNGMYSWAGRMVDVVGWIDSKTAIQKREMTNFGAKNWCCHERHLNSMATCPFRQ